MSAIDAGVKPRSAANLEPVSPAVELVEYDREIGVGRLKIDGKLYLMFRLSDRGRTVGLRLSRYCEKLDIVKRIDIDFGVPGWACDCEDATYRPGRPGGCKHLFAARLVAAELRARMRCRKAQAQKED